MEAVVVLAFLALAVAAAAAVGYSYLAAKKRREQLLAFAASRGWTFAQEVPQLVDRFTGPPFGLGFGRRAYNVLFGNHGGRDLVSFDYEYKTQTTNGQQTTTSSHPSGVIPVPSVAATRTPAPGP